MGEVESGATFEVSELIFTRLPLPPIQITKMKNTIKGENK
jgi:hypothetical protein